MASNAVLAGVILDNTDRTPVIPAMRHLGLVKAATNVFGYSPGSQPLTGTSPANETGSADDLPPLSLRIPSEGFGEREGALGHKCLGEYRPQHGTDIDSGMWPVSTVTDRIGLSRSQSSLPCDRAQGNSNNRLQFMPLSSLDGIEKTAECVTHLFGFHKAIQLPTLPLPMLRPVVS